MDFTKRIATKEREVKDQAGLIADLQKKLKATSQVEPEPTEPATVVAQPPPPVPTVPAKTAAAASEIKAATPKARQQDPKTPTAKKILGFSTPKSRISHIAPAAAAMIAEDTLAEAGTMVKRLPNTTTQKRSWVSLL